MPRVNSSMTIVVIMVSLVVLGIFNIALADPDPANNQSDFSIKHGTKALQFQLGSAFSLRNDNGMSLAYKYFLGSKSALKLGIGLSGSFENTDTDSERYSYSDSSIYSEKISDDRNGNSIDMSIQYLKIHSVSPKLNFMWGLGPYLRYSRNHDEEKYSPNDSAWTEYKYDYDIFTPGISYTIGAEWFVSRRISVTADYGIAVYYSHRTQNDTRDDSNPQPSLTSKHTANAFGWNSMATTIGVSVYF